MKFASLLLLYRLAAAQNATRPDAADGSKIIFQGSRGPVSLNQCNSACASFNVILFQTCAAQQLDYRQQMRCGCTTSFIAQAQICGSCCSQLGYSSQAQAVMQVVNDCQIIVDKGNTSSVAGEIPYKTVTSIQTVLSEKTRTKSWTDYTTNTKTEYATRTTTNYATRTWPYFASQTSTEPIVPKWTEPVTQTYESSSCATQAPYYTETTITSTFSTWSTHGKSSSLIPCITTWTSAWFSTQSGAPCPAPSSNYPDASKTKSSGWISASPTIFFSSADGMTSQVGPFDTTMLGFVILFAISCIIL